MEYRCLGDSRRCISFFFLSPLTRIIFRTAHSHRDTTNDSNCMKLFAVDWWHEAIIDNINVCDQLSPAISDSEVQNRNSIGCRKKNVIFDGQTVE